MQRKRNGGLPPGLPGHSSPEYRAQEVVLLELVVSPPEAGDRLDDLAARLPVATDAVGPAIAALEAAGLAERHGEMARATVAALHFEHLWPLLL